MKLNPKLVLLVIKAILKKVFKSFRDYNSLEYHIRLATNLKSSCF